MEQSLRVALVWNGTVLQEETVRRPAPMVLGRSGAHGLLLPVGDAIDGTHTLLEPMPDGWLLRFGGGVQGRVVADGKTVEVADGVVLLRPGDYAVVRIGAVAVYVQYVQPEPSVGPAWLPHFGGVAPAAVASIAAHLTLLLLIFSALPNLRTQQIDAEHNRWGAAVLMEPPPPPELLPWEVEPAVTEASASQVAAPADTGQAGAADDDPTVLPDRDGPSPDRISPEIGVAMEAALAISGDLTRVFGQSDELAMAFGTEFATAGQGDVFVLGPGTALGIRGPGEGGGGPIGTVHAVGGLARGDTSGRCAPGQADCQATIRRRAETTRSAVVVRERPQVGTFLRRDEIERVVRRHSRGIQYCYDQALLRDASLAGRVLINWTIGLDGRVLQATVAEDTLRDGGVAQCIAGEVQRMRFPTPDGGHVAVSYPFTFRNSGP